MEIEPDLKNIAILMRFCQREGITSFQVPCTSFYMFKFGSALDYPFIGYSLEDRSYESEIFHPG